MIAALFVKRGGAYYGLDGVDPWDEERNARLYDGPWPVVAHPPCQRWGKMWAGQPLWIKRTGQRKIKGDDAGCFKSAFASLKRVGGILEHPWGSYAWPHFGIRVPPRAGGWVRSGDLLGDHGVWTCCVEQGRYGHYARKPTLLVAVGCELPELKWGHSPASYPQEAIDRHGLAYCKRAGELAFKGGGTDSSSRIGTPIPFRDLLLSIAETANLRRAA